MSIGSRHRAWVDAAVVDDTRDRPDANTASLGQVRLRAGLTLSFGSEVDRMPLPPGRPRSQ
jgi:hypothetical protein